MLKCDLLSRKRGVDILRLIGPHTGPQELGPDDIPGHLFKGQAITLIPLNGFHTHAVALAHAFKRELSGLGAVAACSLMLDGLILHFQGHSLFAGQNRFTLTEVVIRHSENGLVIRHIADDTGHIAIPGKLAGHLAAVARDDLIAAALTGTHKRGLVDAAVADALHQRFHFRIVTDTERMILERVQVGKVKIDDFLFFGAGSVAGCRRHFRGRGCCLFLGGSMGLASLWRLDLLGGCLFRLGRTAFAGFGGLALFLGQLLLDCLFLLLGCLVTGSGKIHHLAGMCRGGIVPAGIRRLCLLLFSLGDFGGSRLLHLGAGNSVGGIRHGLAHFKERRLPLLFQHNRLCVSQHRHGGNFYRGSGCLSRWGYIGNIFLIICHLQTSFSWHEKSQSADRPGGSDLPSWCYI